jgi:hypothetical protein
MKPFLNQYKILRSEAAFSHLLEAWAANALAGVEAVLGRCETICMSVAKHNTGMSSSLLPSLLSEKARQVLPLRHNAVFNVIQPLHAAVLLFNAGSL